MYPLHKFEFETHDNSCLKSAKIDGMPVKYLQSVVVQYASQN